MTWPDGIALAVGLTTAVLLLHPHTLTETHPDSTQNQEHSHGEAPHHPNDPTRPQ